MATKKRSLLASLAALAALLAPASALAVTADKHATATTAPAAHDSFSFGPRIQHAQFHADALLASSASFDRGAGSVHHGRAARPALTLSQATQRAIAHAATRAGVDAATLHVTSAHVAETSGTTHIYLAQRVNGLNVAFAEANVSVDKSGNVVAFGEALFRGKPPGGTEAGVAVGSGFASMEQHAFTLASATASSPKVTPAQALANVLSRAKLEIPPHVALDDTLPFTPTTTSASPAGSLGAFAAIKGVTQSPIPVALEYIHVPTPTGSGTQLKLAYAFEVDAADGGAWFESRACALTGEVLSITSYVAEYAPGPLAPPLGRRRRGSGKRHNPAWWQGDTRPSPSTPGDAPVFRVYPVGCNDPADGCKRKLVRAGAPATVPPGQDGAEEVADPGWLAPGTGEDTATGAGKPAETAGNNVVAELNPGGDDVEVVEWPPSPLMKRRRGKATDGKRKFDSSLDLKDDPSKYADAAVAQLFYTVNALHDIAYRYGFTEAAGNFQLDNLGRGGSALDPVLALAQDGSGYNNANFATPPDGKSGRMRMYMWNTAAPYRDGDLESGIVAHEMMHGITTRLTGGRMNSGCLAWGEAGGMGEGWGDVLATLLRLRNAKMASRKHADAIGGWHMGKYASGGKKGIRKYPYAGNMTINPSVYSTLNSPGYFGVHAKGEVWAVMLLEVFWDLVDVLGFSTEWRDDFSTRKHTKPNLNSAGSLFMQILMDALQIQPCRPSFTDARDAMLVAEAVLTGGKHTCLMWRAFARRGLGVDAKQIPANSPWEDDMRVDGFNVPAECKAA